MSAGSLKSVPQMGQNSSECCRCGGGMCACVRPRAGCVCMVMLGCFNLMPSFCFVVCVRAASLVHVLSVFHHPGEIHVSTARPA